jgi:D-3-phosphoglycerate dehydrogenase
VSTRMHRQQMDTVLFCGRYGRNSSLRCVRGRCRDEDRHPRDYLDTLRTLDCFRRARWSRDTVWTATRTTIDVLASAIARRRALVLIRERTAHRAPLLERLPKLRLISSACLSAYPAHRHRGLYRLGVMGCSNLHSDTRAYATAELTWGLVLAAMRKSHAGSQPESRPPGKRASGSPLRSKRLGIFGYGRIRGMCHCVLRRGVRHAGAGVVGRIVHARARDVGYTTVSNQRDLFETATCSRCTYRLVAATRAS